MKKLYLILLIVYSHALVNAQTIPDFDPTPLKFVYKIILPRTNAVATAFTTQFKGKYYLITARHVVVGHKIDAPIDVWIDRGIDTFKTKLKLDVPATDYPDIAVFHLMEGMVSPEDSIKIPSLSNTLEVTIGEKVFFLGFPSVILSSGSGIISSGVNSINRNKVIVPLVKFGRIIGWDLSKINSEMLIIDAQSMPGFSGSPVFWYNKGKSKFEIIGLLSGGIKSNITRNGATVVDMHYQTSLSFATSVTHLIQLLNML